MFNGRRSDFLAAARQSLASIRDGKSPMTKTKHQPKIKSKHQPKKTLKDMTPYRIKWLCPAIWDGIHQEVTDDVFDAMVQALNTETPSTTPTAKMTRRNPGGSYNKKPLDEDYFKKHYQQNLSTPITCPDCGKTISRKSNLSTHRNTSICKKHSNRCWKFLSTSMSKVVDNVYLFIFNPIPQVLNPRQEDKNYLNTLN